MIVNATEPKRIVVTAADIRRGIRRDPEKCAFATACRRADPDVTGVRFLKSRAYIDYKDGHTERHPTTPSMQQQIAVYDQNGDFEPGEYQLAACPPSMSRKPTGKVGGKGGGKGKPRFRHVSAFVRQ